MLLSLALLFLPAPQMHVAASSGGNDKPVVVEIAAFAPARPLLPARDSVAGGTDHSSFADFSFEPPDIPFSTDTPSLASVKRFELGPPEAILPARLDLRVAESSSAGRMAPGRPLRPGLHPSETVANRRLWYALVISSHSAATFDAWSTRRAVSSGQGREANPMLRPFSHSNAIYFAVQASPALMDYLGRRMMTSHYDWVRRMWWLPQAAGTATSFFSGVHNVRIMH